MDRRAQAPATVLPRQILRLAVPREPHAALAMERRPVTTSDIGSPSRRVPPQPHRVSRARARLLLAVNRRATASPTAVPLRRAAAPVRWYRRALPIAGTTTSGREH